MAGKVVAMNLSSSGARTIPLLGAITLLTLASCATPAPSPNPAGPVTLLAL
jgi:hypothetical protein